MTATSSTKIGVLATMCLIAVLGGFLSLSPAGVEQLRFDPHKPDFWIVTSFTYALVHGNLLHFLVNAGSIATSGPLVWAGGGARFRGTVVFVALFFLTSSIGAMAHMLSGIETALPLVGASAGASGFMAFGAFHLAAVMEPEARRKFLAVSILNFVFAGVVLAILVSVYFDIRVSWQAHMAGFLAGYFMFELTKDRVGEEGLACLTTLSKPPPRTKS